VTVTNNPASFVAVTKSATNDILKDKNGGRDGWMDVFTRFEEPEKKGWTNWLVSPVTVTLL
jgi:hypothetical protein